MKLKINEVYGQRDSRWAGLLLGYNTNAAYTIGQYGCLITALGDYINKNPQEVNDLLKANSGFTQNSGEFIWSKCTVLGLNQTYLSPRYADAVTSQGISKMKELLDGGLPLVTEIDFNPATTGEEMHFVLVISYEGDQFFIADPWTGQIVSLDVYGGAPRAVIQFRAYDKKLDNDSGVTVAVPSATFENLVRKSTITDKVAAKLNVEVSEDIILANLDKLITLEDVVVQKDKLIQEAQDKIGKLEADNVEKGKTLEQLQLDHQELTKKIDKAVEDNLILEGKIKQLKDNVKTPTLSGWKLRLYKWLTSQK